MSATNRESDRFMLRLPDGMRDRIKHASEANSRSMNAEIVATLEEKYPEPLSDEVQIRIAASAARMFHPSRAGGAFSPSYKMVISYVSEYFGISDAEEYLTKVWAEIPQSESVTASQIDMWLTEVLRPWMDKQGRTLSPD